MLIMHANKQLVNSDNWSYTKVLPKTNILGNILD